MVNGEKVETVLGPGDEIAHGIVIHSDIQSNGTMDVFDSVAKDNNNIYRHSIYVKIKGEFKEITKFYRDNATRVGFVIDPKADRESEKQMSFASSKPGKVNFNFSITHQYEEKTSIKLQ